MYPEGEFKAALQSRGKKKITVRVFTFYTKMLIWSFHVIVMHGMAKKCPNRYNARTESVIVLLIRALSVVFAYDL